MGTTNRLRRKAIFYQAIKEVGLEILTIDDYVLLTSSNILRRTPLSQTVERRLRKQSCGEACKVLGECVGGVLLEDLELGV